MYTEFADDHVKRFEKKGKLKKISRAKVEYQLLQEINKADLVIDCKLSWTHAVSILSNYSYDNIIDPLLTHLLRYSAPYFSTLSGSLSPDGLNCPRHAQHALFLTRLWSSLKSLLTMRPKTAPKKPMTVLKRRSTMN